MLTFNRTVVRLLILGCVSTLGFGLAGPAQAAPQLGGVATSGGAVPAPAAVAASAVGSVGAYVALTPVRLLDTRQGLGAAGPIGAGQSVTLSVRGKGGIAPSQVSAVALNVTITNPTVDGYLTVYADGSALPATSNINFSAGQTIANMVIVPVLNGAIELYNGAASGSTEIIADSAGYFVSGTTIPTAAGTFQAVSPNRLLDTRVGVGGPRASLQGHTSRALSVLGATGLPSAGVRAVVLNVAATGPTASGYLTVYPNGQPLPNTTNVSFDPGQTVASLVVVPVSGSGQVLLYNGSARPINAIADVVGYYLEGNPGALGSLLAVPQTRLLDTRQDTGAIAPLGTLSLQVSGAGLADGGTVPASGINAVALNVTAITPGARGYLTVYPTGPQPAISHLDFAAGQTVSNLVIVPIGSDGEIQLYNSSGAGTDLVVDLVGVVLDGTGAARCNAVALGSTPDPVKRWNPLVSCILSVLGQAQSASNVSDVDTIILDESSGDPNAVNRYDRNWKEGHPSEGLIQVIRPTFEEWRSVRLSDDLLNPAANLYAGLNYAINTYGSIHNVPGLVSLRGGGGYVGYVLHR